MSSWPANQPAVLASPSHRPVPARKPSSASARPGAPAARDAAPSRRHWQGAGALV